MTQPGSYPPPSFSCPTQERSIRQPTFHWSPQQQPQQAKFQACKDWSWFEAAAPRPWNSGPAAAAAQRSCYPNYAQNPYAAPCHPYGREGHGQNARTKHKKQKEPELSHFCDTCDRGFKNQAKYEEHVAQHVKCPVEDCRFTAHEKLVKIHWKNNHAPGTKRIKLDTPEEISKWREERRKNYPTLCNVEKKMKIMEAKKQRGDVLENANFSRFKSHVRGRGGRFQNSTKGGNQSFHLGRAGVEQPPPPSHSAQDGDPLDALAKSDPDSEKDESEKIAVSVIPKRMTSALGSLMSSYGADVTESENEEELHDTLILKTSQVLEGNKAMLEDHSVPTQNGSLKLEIRPTTAWSTTSKQSPNPYHLSHQSKRGGFRGRGGHGSRGCRDGYGSRSGLKNPVPSLLEMLLAPDIRHERNVLLQCVRYIVYNEFFGLASKDSNLMRPVTDNGETSGDKLSRGIIAKKNINEAEHSGMAVCLDSLSQEENSSVVQSV